MPDEKIKISPKKIFTVGELLETHEQYEKNKTEWQLLNAVYGGIRKIIAAGLITRHERESFVSYERRISELYGFGYTKSVVEIFHFYLFKKESDKILGGLAENTLWKMFINDADLYGGDFDAVMMDIGLNAAILGHMGVMVDKSSATFSTLQEQIDEEVYPYISKYFPSAILDWEFKRDSRTDRPYLSYLKLLDEDGRYRVWYIDQWEIWELPTDEKGEKRDGVDAEAKLVSAGVNPIEVIPFIWHYNFKSNYQGIGVSDIHEVSRIDLSIIRTMSQLDEVFNFAAFPMMRKPMRDAKPTDVSAPQQDDEVSVQVVLEFDPEHPDSKPDWLKAEVADPIKAGLDMVSKKVEEIYRAANIGGMAATEIQKQARSGVALRSEFQLLNSKLISKGINLEDTEMRILEYWLRWENLWNQYKDKVKIKRKKTYDIENLTADLANALTARTIVISKKFNEILQKQTARMVLPSANENDLATIDEEIETELEKPPEKNLTDDMDDYMDDEDKEVVDPDVVAKTRTGRTLAYSNLIRA